MTLILIFKVEHVLVMHLLYTIAQAADISDIHALTRTVSTVDRAGMRKDNFVLQIQIKI